MKNLKKHFEENYQLLLTNSQLVEIARAALEDCKPEIKQPDLTVDDLVRGEWYVFKEKRGFNNDKGFLAKFDYISNDCIYCHKSADLDGILPINYNKSCLCDITDLKSIRHATREEIVKYFPHEFEIDSHGGNDIPRVTDEQL